ISHNSVSLPQPAPSVSSALSLPDALPIYPHPSSGFPRYAAGGGVGSVPTGGSGPRFPVAHHLPAEVVPDPDEELAHPGIAPESRSEEHTSELQSRENLVCRLLLEQKNNIN